MTESDSKLDAFLADHGGKELKHYGVKGMRWGIRRTDAELSPRKVKQLARVEAKTAKLEAKNEKLQTKAAKLSGTAAQLHMDRMKPGETVVAKAPDGGLRTLVKRDDGKFNEVYLSSDAERMMKIQKKSASELSNQDMKDAVARARAVEEYNKLINPLINPSTDPNMELASKVQALRLQQEYNKLNAQMNPSASKRLSKFIKTVAPSYKTFQTLDKATGGILSKEMKKAWQDAFNAKPKSSSDKTYKKSSFSFPKRKPRPSSKPKEDVSRPDVVYNISDVGGATDFPSPLTLPIEARKS